MNALDYYLGPTGIPDKLRAAGRALNYLNPVNALGESMQASQRLFAPDTDGWGRVQATGDMLTGMAGVVAPSMVASRAGMPAANALQEGLMGFAYSPGARMAADDAGRFMADESGALNYTRRPDAYAGSHRAPNRDGYGAPLHNLAGDIYPDDIYSPQAWQYYGHGEPALDRRTAQIIQRFRGKPDADVTIYRAVPKGQTDINAGDWVTVNRDYARQHGESWLDGEYDIIAEKVKAGELFTDGNSIHEFGWDPAPSLNPAEARAQNVLDYLTSGRASEVTDEMLEGADPQYLYRNYDLPMDYDSRMARADAGWPASSAHGSGEAITAVDNERLIGGQFWSTDDLQAIADREVGAAGYGVTTPLRLNLQNPAGWSEYDKFGVSELMGRGYDGLKLKDDPSLMNPGTRNTYVTFNPEQVRSRFARFDPRLAHLRNLSAGIGALGLFGDYDQRDNAFGSQ